MPVDGIGNAFAAQNTAAANYARTDSTQLSAVHPLIIRERIRQLTHKS